MTPLLEKLVDGVPSALPAASGANLPTLSRVLDRDELGQRLVVLLGSQWGGGLRVERMHLLKWRSPKRCLIEFLLQTDMIGKVYAKDRADVYRFMEALNRAGFDRAAQFSIPQPIGYLPDLYLLLQAKVRGVKAKEIFLTGDDPARAMASEQCAGWLARFHAAAPQWGPVLRTEKFLRRCEAKRRHLSDQGADLYFKSSQLFEELEASRASLADTPMCAGHGDFGYHQVIFAEGRTVVCDWDVYDVCDPARDVARFIVALKRLALKNLGSIRELDGAAEIFLKKYRDSGGPSLPEEQVRFFNAAYCLWEAQWEAKRRRPEWHERAEAMLDEGLRALGEQKTLRVPELATGSVSKPRGGTRA